MISAQQIIEFQQKILTWYTTHQRDLPWRKTRDPYHILVSEIMLQQTQVGRVIPKFEAWLVAFPTVTALASASTADVLRLWSGLGYNRRALYLKKAAEEIARLAGTFPTTIEKLKKLPGIGEYTARAVACFAFDAQIAVVDTNVRKVILLHFPPSCHCEEKRRSNHNHKKDCRALLAMTPGEIQEIADALLPVGKAYEWNQALMDYSSAVLKEEKIPIPKQSTFKGSNRYYRGQILKLLLKNKQMDITEVVKSFDKDKEFLTKIIDGLIKDGFLQMKEGILSLL